MKKPQSIGMGFPELIISACQLVLVVCAHAEPVKTGRILSGFCYGPSLIKATHHNVGSIIA